MTNIGPRRKAPPVAKPEGFEPPYDAFEPRFRDIDDLVLVTFGIENRGGDDTGAKARLLTELSHETGPSVLEHGRVKTGFGPNCEVWFAYWKSQSQYDAWLAASEIEALFEDNAFLTGPVGLWREYSRISLDHNETSGSRAENVSGIANMADAMEITPDHAYWGSCRDRMVATVDDQLAATGGVSDVPAGSSLGRRVKVQAPANACLIKTTQDLAMINDEQFAKYKADVEPALHRGLTHIRENSADTGCFGMRFVEEIGGAEAPQPRTVGLGYFASLGHLEEWTHHHPTHLDIMAQFGGMVEQFQGQPGLHLWHEVSVFPEGWLTGDYVNCSADGTLMASA